jgi:hypothetical protein
LKKNQCEQSNRNLIWTKKQIDFPATFHQLHSFESFETSIFKRTHPQLLRTVVIFHPPSSAAHSFTLLRWRVSLKVVANGFASVTRSSFPWRRHSFDWKTCEKKRESLNFPLKTSFLDGNLGNIISFHDDGNLEDVATFLRYQLGPTKAGHLIYYISTLNHRFGVDNLTSPQSHDTWWLTYWNCSCYRREMQHTTSCKRCMRKKIEDFLVGHGSFWVPRWISGVCLTCGRKRVSAAGKYSNTMTFSKFLKCTWFWFGGFSTKSWAV